MATQPKRHLNPKQIRFLWAIGYFRPEKGTKDGFRVDRRNAQRYFNKQKRKS